MKTNKKDIEMWLPIENSEGCYEVSNTGKIRRIKKAKGTFCGILKIKYRLCNKGKYTVPFVILSVNGKKHTASVSRLVAQAFISNPRNKPQVNHIDFDSTNNHVSNLEWVTIKENYYHSRNCGRFNNAYKTSKLAQFKVECLEITRRFLAGEVGFVK